MSPRRGFSFIPVILVIAIILLGLIYFSLSDKSIHDVFTRETKTASDTYIVYFDVEGQKHFSVDLKTGKIYELPRNSYVLSDNKLYYSDEEGIWTLDYVGENKAHLFNTEQPDLDLFCPIRNRVTSVSPNETTILIENIAITDPYVECDVDESQNYGRYLLSTESNNIIYMGEVEDEDEIRSYFRDWDETQLPIFLYKGMLMSTNEDGSMVESNNPVYLKLNKEVPHFESSTDGNYAVYMDDKGKTLIDPFNPDRDLVLHNLENDTKTVLVKNDFSVQYKISPDGKNVAYNDLESIGQLIIYDIETGGTLNLKPERYDVQFSSGFYWIDDRYLLVSGNDFSKYLVDIEKETVEFLFENITFDNRFKNVKQLDNFRKIIHSNSE